MERIETQRLRLEVLEKRHAAGILGYYERNKKHLKRWEPDRSAAFYTLAYHEADVARSEENGLRGVSRRFAVFEGGDDEDLVGLVNLWNVRRGVIHAATLGYSVDARRQGRGIATEAARAVVAYAFDVLKLHRIETSYQPENTASGKVLRRLGFAVEGYARDYLLLDGQWRDAILVGLVNPAWSALSL